MVVSNEGTSLYFGGLNHQNDEDEDIASMGSGVKIIKDLDDEKLWATFGKKRQDFTIGDIRKLIFKYLDLCCEFYKMYVKSKVSEFRKNQHARAAKPLRRSSIRRKLQAHIGHGFRMGIEIDEIESPIIPQ